MTEGMDEGQRRIAEGARRLQAELNRITAPSTPYDSYVADAYQHLDEARSYADVYEDPQETVRTKEFNEADRATVSAHLAVAEQQRIANLLTVALDSHSPVGGSRFNFAAREMARDQALAALGLPTGAPQR